MSDLLSFIEFNQYNLPLILQILGLYIVLLWLAVVAWVFRGITTRSHNLLIVIFTALFVLIGNLPALVLYLLLRPERTIEDQRSKDLFLGSVLDKDVTICSDCGVLVRADYKFCPNCSHQLQEKCPNCGIITNPTWNFCINCNFNLVKEPWYLKFGKGIKAHIPKLVVQFPKAKLRLPKFNRPKEVKNKVLAVQRNDTVSFTQKKVSDLNRTKTSFSASSNQTKGLKAAVMVTAGKELLAGKQLPRPAEQSTNVTTEKTKPTPVKTTINNKPKRGRPKGVSDHLPRRKRSDVGIKRANYSRSK